MSLPEYTIKTSNRARNVRFKIKPEEGLCVVIPRGFDPAGVPQLVANKKAWIEKALKDVAARATPTPANFLPDKLALPAIDETWAIGYQGGAKRASLVADSVKRQLVFSAPEHVQDTVFNVLRSKRVIQHEPVQVVHHVDDLCRRRGGEPKICGSPESREHVVA